MLGNANILRGKKRLCLNFILLHAIFFAPISMFFNVFFLLCVNIWCSSMRKFYKEWWSQQATFWSQGRLLSKFMISVKNCNVPFLVPLVLNFFKCKFLSLSHVSFLISKSFNTNIETLQNFTTVWFILVLIKSCLRWFSY